jgi:hypothetical protein
MIFIIICGSMSLATEVQLENKRGSLLVRMDMSHSETSHRVVVLSIGTETALSSETAQVPPMPFGWIREILH